MWILWKNYIKFKQQGFLKENQDMFEESANL